MNKARTTELRRMLLANREKVAAGIRQRISDIKENSSSITRRVEGNTNTPGAYCDIQEIDTDLERSLIQMADNKLALIDEALRRLGSGQYGNCPDCGNEISEARLRALPFAIRCVGCEKLREKSA